MKHLTLVDHNIDWKTLRDQKLQLISVIEDKAHSECEITKEEANTLEGILDLIDFIQDQAVDNNNFHPMEVFNQCDFIGCDIRFKNSVEIETVHIGVCPQKYLENGNVPINDEDIFYYIDSVNDLHRLLQIRGGDFVIVPGEARPVTIQPMIGHEEIAWIGENGHPVFYDSIEQAQKQCDDDWEERLELHPNEHDDNKDFVGYARLVGDGVYFVYDADHNYLFTHDSKERT